jgi:hypothetical protein
MKIVSHPLGMCVASGSMRRSDMPAGLVLILPSSPMISPRSEG